MATALTVSMLAGCSSGSSGTTKATETKDTKASAETTAETAAAAGDSDTILKWCFPHPLPVLHRQMVCVLSREPSWQWMRLMRPAAF